MNNRERNKVVKALRDAADILDAEGVEVSALTSLESTENVIRDMFLSRQYNGKVPVKDVLHILKSPRWVKRYGKGNVAKAWKELVAEEYVELKGNFWVWQG